MDNSADRLVDVFFYGLYMDISMLENFGVVPQKVEVGFADGYRLRIGNHATLLRSPRSKAFGVVCALKHSDVYKLYPGAGLKQYVPEAVAVKRDDGKAAIALSYVLLEPPHAEETNDDYCRKLDVCMKRYGLSLPKST